MNRVLFKEAMIIDGSGKPPFRGDVLPAGNRIAAVDKQVLPLPGSDTRIINAAGFTIFFGAASTKPAAAGKSSALL